MRHTTKSTLVRRVATAAALLAATAVLSGCTGGPSPEDQRQEMITVTRSVIDGVMSPEDTGDPAILDDGTRAVTCAPEATQYRYIAYAVTESYSNMEDADAILDDVSLGVIGVSAQGSGGGDYYGYFQEVERELDSAEPRQIVFVVKEGSEAGSSLTVDLVLNDDDSVLIRFAGATTCK